MAAITKTEFRDRVRTLLAEQVGELELDDKLTIVQQCCIEAQVSAGFDEGNKGNAWTDEELRVVLQHAPTKENCIFLARAFRRGYGSIEQIFRWAASTDDEVAAKRPDDTFIQQIKRVGRQVGWRAT
jgi:hypothetical protein